MSHLNPAIYKLLLESKKIVLCIFEQKYTIHENLVNHKSQTKQSTVHSRTPHLQKVFSELALLMMLLCADGSFFRKLQDSFAIKMDDRLHTANNVIFNS